MDSTNYSIGHDAEMIVAEYLPHHGFKILELNWKTRYCEIDIVAQKGKVIYLIEVKSRKNSFQGSGLEYITSKKLKQMELAAKFWVASNNWNGELRLAAVGITGSEISFEEEIWV